MKLIRMIVQAMEQLSVELFYDVMVMILEANSPAFWTLGIHDDYVYFVIDFSSVSDSCFINRIMESGTVTCIKDNVEAAA